MTLAIAADRLIADPAAEPIADGAVLVDEETGMVIYAGPAGDAPEVEVRTTLECPGQTVLPGMIDTHTHITADFGSGLTLEEMRNAESTTAVLSGHTNLTRDLRAGVTTMRTLGDPEGLDVAFREAIAAGIVEGPRLHVCARALRPSHGTARFTAMAVDGPEALRHTVRRNFEAGADVIKLFATNVMHGRTYDDYLRGDLTTTAAYTREEIAAAIDEAHRLGIPVAAHAIGGDAMRWAIEEGIDSIEHANLMEESDIELFVEHGTFLSDPNLQLYFDPETGFETIAAWRHDWWREKVAIARELIAANLAGAVAAGVPVCLGGDSLHGELWREAVQLARLGVPTARVLEAVTTNGARLLRIDDHVGTLEPGRAADLIAVDGNPLDDMAALADVRLVVKEGRPVAALTPGARPCIGSTV